MTEKDAWRQHDELLDRFTKEWEVRPDLVVTAYACDRSVQFSLIEIDPTKDRFDLQREHHHTTQRSVSTMQELAEALLAACDFVEESNPTWAEDGRRLRGEVIHRGRDEAKEPEDRQTPDRCSITVELSPNGDLRSGVGRWLEYGEYGGDGMTFRVTEWHPE